MHDEVQRSTQVLLNNGFDSNDINTQTKRILDKSYHQEQETPSKKSIRLYYQAHFSTNYRKDEKIIKQIIKKNVTPTDPDKKLNLIIYYKSIKTSHLLLRNSPKLEKGKTQQSYIVYRYTCTQGNCAALTLSSYIGMTTIIATYNDTRRLPTLEALYIKDCKLKLNTQTSDLQALPSMRRNNDR